LVHEAWSNPVIGDKLKVIPVATNYSQWHGTGNNTYVEFLEPIEKNVVPELNEQGLFLRKFNTVLHERLATSVASVHKTNEIEIQNTVTGFLLKNFENGDELARKSLKKFGHHDATKFHKTYAKLAHFIKKEKLKYYESNPNIVSFIVAQFIMPFATILNVLPYSICKYIAEKTTHKNVFYDSVFFGSLLLLGPIYMLGIGILG